MNDNKNSNDMNYAEYLSSYGQKLREEQAKEFHKPSSFYTNKYRAKKTTGPKKTEAQEFMEFERRKQHETDLIRGTRILRAFPVAFVMALILALALLFTGSIGIVEALVVLVVGTIFFIR